MNKPYIPKGCDQQGRYTEAELVEGMQPGDMPPDLVLPPHDVMAPAGAAATVEVGEE